MISTYYSKAAERELVELAAPRLGSWVVAMKPTADELQRLVTEFGLDEDNLNDAVDLYEAPRIDVERGIVYIYTRYCHPEGEEIATEPLLIVSTKDQLMTVTRVETTVLRRLLANGSDVVTTQKTKTLLQILSEINLSYERQLIKVAKRILQLRAKMRQGQISNREFLSIIELEEDLNEFLSALQPQALLYGSLVSGKHLKLYEQDRDIVEDLERGTAELIEQLRNRLRTLGNMREAYDAIATTNLNNTFKRLTSIAIFLTVPTIVGGLWGMNVAIPGEHSRYAFYYVLVLIGGLLGLAVWIFRRNKWL